MEIDRWGRASTALLWRLSCCTSPINRRVYFRPVMYAPPIGDEIFDNDRLVVDVIVEAVIRMRANGGPRVIIVNLSLGDRTKPFAGKISTWARALDFLAFTYGILFLVSAGNIEDGITIREFVDAAAFEAAAPADRAKAAFRALDALSSPLTKSGSADSLRLWRFGG